MDLNLDINPPAHIIECANAVRADLLFGPRYAHIPDDDITKFDNQLHTADCTSLSEIPEPFAPVYSGPVGNALREYIEDMPSELYVDEDGYVSEDEPEGYSDDCPECGHLDDPNPDCPSCDGSGEVWYKTLSHIEIVTAVFGRTIATEFR